MTYVYLKTQNYSGTDLTLDTIPLNVTSVAISVNKIVPAIPIPLSALFTGESETAALDLGMASKTLSLTGLISDTVVQKTIGNTPTSRTFTAHEVAQMIASGVDSTGLAKNQAFSELVILMHSFVGNDYEYKSGVDITDRSTGVLVPLTFHSRGGVDEKENEGVGIVINSFPDVNTQTGLTGFVRSFSCNFEAEAHDISFTLEFEVARIFP